MKYQYWKCTICGGEFRTSTQMSEFDIREHLDTHKKESAELEQQISAYADAVSDLNDKFPKRVMGFWIKNITPPVVKKLWTCPRCGEKISYHLKAWHQANATKKGKDYQCRVKSTK